MITMEQREHAIRALVDLHGIRLGLPADIRVAAIYLALTTYRAEGYASAHRAIETGREVLDDVAEGYAILSEVGHG